jgi:hypothetical protein
MIGPGRMAVEAFNAQFEREGDVYLYRKSQRAAPIRVSREELERFLRNFEKAYRLVFWGFIILTCFTVFGTVLWTISRGEAELNNVAIGAAILIPAGLFMLAHHWIWGAPARALTGRMTAGRRRTWAEVDRRFLKGRSYGAFALPLLGLILVHYQQTRWQNLLSGWNLMLTTMVAGAALLAAVQMFRKWRLERTSARAD